MSMDFSAPISQSDALGGAGSITPALQAIAVSGLSRAIDGYLSTKYPLTAFNEPYGAEGYGAFEPGGYLVPRSAPGGGSYGTSAIGFGPSITPGMIGILVIGLVIVIALAASK